MDQYFHIETYSHAYSKSIIPIPAVGKPMTTIAEAVIKHPVMGRQPGRPKKKKILSRGEITRQIKCGRCGRLGVIIKSPARSLLINFEFFPR